MCYPSILENRIAEPLIYSPSSENSAVLTMPNFSKTISLGGAFVCVLLSLIFLVQNVLFGIGVLVSTLIPFGLKNAAITRPKYSLLYWLALLANSGLALLFLWCSLEPSRDQLFLIVVGTPIFLAYAMNVLFVVRQKSFLVIGETVSKMSIMALLLIPVAAHATYWSYLQVIRPAPLVFLISDGYVGPVYFFFDQRDGVDTKPDPFGQAVQVPENGIVKLRASERALVDEPIPLFEGIRPGRKAQYVVSVSKSGQRKTLKFYEGTIGDDSDVTRTVGYTDESNKWHGFPVPGDWKGKPDILALPEPLHDEAMVIDLYHYCRSSNFLDNKDPKVEAFGCGKFLVATPNQFVALPKWLWSDLDFGHPTIAQFVADANDRVAQKRELYAEPTSAVLQSREHVDHATTTPSR